MKKRLKIAMLIDGWEPIFGGGQVHVNELCRGLAKNHDCRVDLFVRKLMDNNGKKYFQDEVYLNGKFKIYRIGPTTKFFNILGRLLSLIYTSFFLIIKAKKEKYDILHAHAFVSGLPAKIVGNLLNIPVIYTVHGANNLDTSKKGILNKIERWLLTGIKYDLELSIGKKFLKYKNVNKNIKSIVTGVDVEKFNNIINEKKYPGISFLWVGRFSWEKGLEYLIEGISLIDKKILKETGFKLNLVGDGENKEKITKMVQKLGLNEFVTLKGKIFGNELIKEYKRNDIFILPSLSEGFGIVLLEAMVSGLIVIATKCGGPEEIIKNNENGFLIEKGDKFEIKKIIEIILNKEKSDLINMLNKGYESIISKYLLSDSVDMIYEIYNELITNYN